MAKCLVIFPPQWSPFSPHLAPVSVVSNIRKSGHRCDVLDLNVEFYLNILKKDKLEKILVDEIQGMSQLSEELKKIVNKDKKPDDYSQEEQLKIKKMLFLENIRQNKLEESKQVIDNVENAVSLLHQKDYFYELKLASNSVGIINKALEIAFLKEYPQEISLYNFKNLLVKLDWNNILEYSSSDTIFKRFYKEMAADIIKKKYDYIGISLSSSSQFLSALILAKLLKERAKKTKICFGGNHISRIIPALKNNPDFFKIFADYVVFEEGERATNELLEHIDGKRKIEDVSSLVYLSKGKVIQNEKKEPTLLSELAMPDLEGFPLEKYFLPEIIMPVQLSRGCYWKKCTFCDHYFGQTYNVKDLDTLINELKTLQIKYGINCFEFTDDCISPSYLKSFSEKIIESNLKIYWYCDLRLENALTKEILELAYKAGLRMVLWGYESGSKRIMDLINKGVDTDKRMEIMKMASDIGIYNFAYVFTGFPSETREEVYQTINAACHNPDIIHSYGTGLFSLGKHSLIHSNPENFGIIKLDDDEEFSSEAKYKTENGLSKEDLLNLEKEFVLESQKEKTNPAWMYLFYRELLFLYIVKYGKDKVINMSYNS